MVVCDAELSEFITRDMIRDNVGHLINAPFQCSHLVFLANEFRVCMVNQAVIMEHRLNHMRERMLSDQEGQDNEKFR